MARQQPVQQPPPVQRLRVQYAKRGTARYASHRDFSRALERALRRAGVPMAYSSGFSPHPRISYAGAAPTGTSSQAEYFELGLAEVCDPAKVAAALNKVLPAGFEVLRIVEASGGPLPARLTASAWTMELPGVPVAALGDLAERLWSAEQVEVVRQTKKGERRFDVRSAIVSLRARDDALHLVLRHGEPLVRPGDIYSALCELAPDLMETADPPRATRTAQGTLDGDQIADPLD